MKYRAPTTRRPEGPDVGALEEGRTLHQIAHLFNRAHTSVRGDLARDRRHSTTGTAPLRDRLTLAEREEISRAVAKASRFARSPPGSDEPLDRQP